MSALSRALVLLALVPACDLYFRSDEEPGGDDDGPSPVDSGALPDAQVPIDAGRPDAPPPPPPNPGFVSPTTTTRAHAFRNGQWTELGAADWSCLAQPPAEPTPANGYSLTGTVRDYGNNQSVGGASIRAVVNGMVIASTTSSSQAGSRGTFRFDLPALPANTSRITFETKVENGVRATVAVDRYLGGLGIAVLDLPLVSNGTINALPAFIGESADPEAGLVVGDVRDCQGRQVSGAIVALSLSSTLVVHWPGGVTFYFNATQNPLPVRHAVRTQTNADGRYMVIDATPMNGDGMIQAWGYLNEADRAAGALRLLGKGRAVIAPEAVSSVIIGRARTFGN